MAWKDLFLDEIKVDYNNSFVQGHGTDNFAQTKRKNIPATSFTGTEARKFYEDLINEKTYKINHKELQNKRNLTKPLPSTSKHSDGDNKIHEKALKNLKYDILKYSAAGNMNQLETLITNYHNKPFYKDILNYTDQYGWSALVCAAAEGHHNVINVLMRESIDVDLPLLQDVCFKRSRENVFQYILSLRKNKSKSVHAVDNIESNFEKTILCDVCGEKYKEFDKQKHESSTVHIFKDNSSVKMLYTIPEGNKGFQMMLRSGWETNKGLGLYGEGRKNPIKTTLKNNRHGLGLDKKSDKKVTHFAANDTRSIKVSPVNNRCGKIKFMNRKVIEKRKRKEKCWEQNLRHYMSSD